MKSMIITILTFVGITGIANGQNNEIRTNGSAYFYQSQKYNIQDLAPLLNDDIEASLLYERGRRKYKSARTLGIISFTTIGLGIITISSVQKPDNLLEVVVLSGPNAFVKTTGTVFIGAGVVCGVVSLANFIDGSRTMDKAVQIFNSKNNPLGYQSTLHMGLTGNGMGLVLGF